MVLQKALMACYQSAKNRNVSQVMLLSKMASRYYIRGLSVVCMTSGLMAVLFHEC